MPSFLASKKRIKIFSFHTPKSLKNKKDMSFFLLKNSLASKMSKNFRSSCNGDGSTSTLDQTHHAPGRDLSPRAAPTAPPSPAPPTLEEMILQLELEEELARRAKLDSQQYEYMYSGNRPGRLSCVNSSDILRSARNALNQYPRFSLDGKDAMYRSFDRNQPREVRVPGRGSEKFQAGLPRKVGGENVVWCKPGVVAKLMGLEEVPLPVKAKRKDCSYCKEKLIMRRRMAQQRRDMS